jgi:hypothetical protein
MSRKKKWWKSKLIWLNAAAGAFAFAAAALPEVASHIPKWLSFVVGTFVAGANVALRFVTTDALITTRINKEDGNDAR